MTDTTPAAESPLPLAPTLELIFDQLRALISVLVDLQFPTPEALVTGGEVTRRLLVLQHLLLELAAESGVKLDRRPDGDLPSLERVIPGMPAPFATRLVAAREMLFVHPAEVAQFIDVLSAVAVADRDHATEIALGLRDALRHTAEVRAGAVFDTVRPTH